jgi:hypothetical protein
MKPQQVTGPMAPAQVTGPSAYYPAQTDYTSMLGMFMPLIMMVLVLSIIGPMLKGATSSIRE